MSNIIKRIGMFMLVLCMVFALNGCTKSNQETEEPVTEGETVSTEVEISTEAKEILASPDTSQLVSVRSWEEYIGETPGYSDSNCI